MAIISRTKCLTQIAELDNLLKDTKYSKVAKTVKLPKVYIDLEVDKSPIDILNNALPHFSQEQLIELYTNINSFIVEIERQILLKT